MKLKSFLALCLGVLFVFPADTQTTSALDSKRTEDICEVAFRYFFTHDGTGGAKAICISTIMPLPMGFISRFAYNNPPVVWSIECTSDLWAGVKYMKSNEPAALIKITSIRWVSGEQAEVKGGSVSGDFLRALNTVNIVKRNGRWLVKRDKSMASPSLGMASFSYSE